MKQKPSEIQIKVNELYGELVRASFGEHTRIGVVILDVSKIKERIYEIKLLLDEAQEKEGV